MNRMMDWNRKHTLILIFLLLLVVALYVLGHQRMIAPLSADDSLVQEGVTRGNQSVDVFAGNGKAINVEAVLAPLATTNGVQLETVAAEPVATPVDGLVSARYTVSVTAGDVQNLHAFLASLASAGRDLQVDRINVQDAGVSGVRLDLGVVNQYQE